VHAGNVRTGKGHSRRVCNGSRRSAPARDRPLLASGDFIAGLRLITEHAARTLGVDSASVWAVRGDPRCLDRYDVDLGTHRYRYGSRAELYPDYFAALNTDRAVPVSDAHTDPRTRRLIAQ